MNGRRNIFTMQDNCSRSKGQRSRSQRHVTYQQTKTITRQRIVISTSNLVGIIDVRVDACGILSRSVGQTNWEVEIWRKFINNRFCACPVQMLLKMAVNETVCSTFEVQYGKSTSTRTTAIRHLGHLQHIT